MNQLAKTYVCEHCLLRTTHHHEERHRIISEYVLFMKSRGNRSTESIIESLLYSRLAVRQNLEIGRAHV